MKRLLRNALMQPHFDYSCASLFSLLNKSSKTEDSGSTKQMHTSLLRSSPRSHIDAIHLGKINWFPVSERVESSITTTACKYWKGIVPSYANDMLKPSCNRYNTRSQTATKNRYRRENRALSFLGLKIWTKISRSSKSINLWILWHII